MKFEFCTPMPLDVADKAAEGLRECKGDPRPSMAWHGAWAWPRFVQTFPVSSGGERGGGLDGLAVVVDWPARDMARAVLRSAWHVFLCRTRIWHLYVKWVLNPRTRRQYDALN